MRFLDRILNRVRQPMFEQLLEPKVI